MARIIHISPLAFQGRMAASNTCVYKGPEEPGHYSSLLTISILATSRTVFERAERQALPEAATTHGEYTKLGPSSFGVGHKYESKGLGACPPEHTVQEFGPPHCEGDPTWASTSVYAYGKVKPKGPHVFVSVGLARQWEGKFGSVLVAVARAIFAGKIH